MISLEQVKALLDDPTISDEEALEIRDQCYALAEIIFEQWQKDKKNGKLPRHKPLDHEDLDSIRDSIVSGS
jgi:hypothetical protein